MKGPISSFRSTLASPMIRGHFLQFAVAAAVAAVLSGLMHIPSANATLLNFDFSFTNTTGNVDGTVTGKIFGLTDNAVSSASKIIITSAPDQLQFLGTGPFPITVMPEPGSKHSFTVEGGRVVAADLNAEFLSTADGGGEAFIALIDNIPGPFFTCQVGGERDEAYDYLAGCTTELINPSSFVEADPPNAVFTLVPEPASLAILVTGLALLLTLRGSGGRLRTYRRSDAVG